MRKILLILFLAFLSVNSVFAEELAFVYINGSNNNDIKMKAWYEKGINKIHPVLKKKFMNNSYIKKNYRGGKLVVQDKPVIFFWGYKSKNDLDFVKDRLELSKPISSIGARTVRSLFTQYIHDAVWVQKTHNMLPILDELNEVVKKETNDGDNIIMYGYSAGSFVTYQYLLNKLRYFKTVDIATGLHADEDTIELINSFNLNDTCLSALRASRAAILTDTGKLIINPSDDILKVSLSDLNDITEKVCAPVDKIRGIVNYASPLVLFYSDMSDSDYEFHYYNKLLVKYVMENGIFMLTVNFREDPLGFPTSNNLTAEEISKVLELEINNPTGVIYDNSGIYSRRMFPFAHTSYWSSKNAFSNGVVNSFVNGYKFQYDKKYQKRVLKRHSKKSEL